MKWNIKIIITVSTYKYTLLQTYKIALHDAKYER